MRYFTTGLKASVTNAQWPKNFPTGCVTISRMPSMLRPTKDADVFPLGLWVYNNMGSHDSGLKKWFYNKFAQEPVVVSEIRPEVRTKMIDEILDNNGYFRGSSSYELVSGKTSARPR